MNSLSRLLIPLQRPLALRQLPKPIRRKSSTSSPEQNQLCPVIEAKKHLSMSDRSITFTDESLKEFLPLFKSILDVIRHKLKSNSSLNIHQLRGTDKILSSIQYRPLMYNNEMQFSEEDKQTLLSILGFDSALETLSFRKALDKNITDCLTPDYLEVESYCNQFLLSNDPIRFSSKSDYEHYSDALNTSYILILEMIDKEIAVNPDQVQFILDSFTLFRDQERPIFFDSKEHHGLTLAFKTKEDLNKAIETLNAIVARTKKN